MADPVQIWTSTTPGARLARAAFLPVAYAFRAVTTIRNALYDARIFPEIQLGVPTVSVGNLSVGGTGKTPLCAWLVHELRRRGATPAILLRGYGEDEPLVHELLSPGVRVLAHPDRVTSAAAAVRGGADVLVLDDAFQHRRAARDVDIVLVSADAGLSPRWPLPAGPWREPIRALRRATIVLVTRKAASDQQVEHVVNAVSHKAHGVPVGVVRFEASDIRAWSSAGRHPISTLAGQRVLVVSAIGDPAAFELQVAAAGPDIEAVRFPDHHPYSDADVAALAERAKGAAIVLCTLKDAVKLGPRWPPDAVSLWYVSQRVTLERGADSMTDLVEELLARREVPR